MKVKMSTIQYVLGNNLNNQFAMLTVPVLQNDYNSMF